MTLVDDEDPVQQLAPEAADKAFGDRVRARCLGRRQHDLHAGGGDDGLEDPAELAVVVADQEPERLAVAATAATHDAALYTRNPADFLGLDELLLIIAV